MENGTKGELAYTVKKADLASEVAVSTEDVFPEVLATSRMIGLMEVAAARVMRTQLKDGEISVGVGVDIKHFAPTPANEDVQVMATFLKMEGKLFLFEVEVFDRAGRVASGTHTRAIVVMDQIMAAAKTRMAE